MNATTALLSIALADLLMASNLRLVLHGTQAS